MKLAETVTFGGAGLDRGAQLRGDPGALAQMVDNGHADVILLWRGKPLVVGERLDRLARIAPDHPVLAGAGAPVFLGLGTGAGSQQQAHFAQELTDWQPKSPDAQMLDSFLDTSAQQHPDLPADHVFAELRQVMTRITARDAEHAATARAVLGWHQSHAFCAKCGAPSQSTMAGWQRNCTRCGAQHFPRTDPVVIMLITRGNMALLGRSHGWPEGMYSLLAGFVEPGETIEAAVRREIHEEAGIDVGAVEYLASQPWPFPSSLMIGCRGEATSEAIRVDDTEMDDVIWVPREEVLQALAGDHPKILPMRNGAIAHFIIRNWLADRLD